MMTKYVLKAGNKFSDVFCNFSGIKQGAPSSVVLVVIFMDEFISILREKCIQEIIINDLQILLHADDTIVLSTDHDLFRYKYNVESSN